MHVQSPLERKLYAKLRHARHHAEGVPYHIISKTLRGEYFLHPSSRINSILTGVIGRAQKNWPAIKLYAYAFLSNHYHLMLEGPPQLIPAFVGFIKGEAARRINQLHRSSGTIWHGRYLSTALPTPESQLAALRYILAQSTKEHLCRRPQDWPGLHCARQLLGLGAPSGAWFDGTRYGKAKHRPSKRKLQKASYYTSCTIALHPLPQWEDLSTEQQQEKVRALVEDIVAAAAKERRRTGKKLLGLRAIRRTKRTQRKTPPRPPWYEERKRCVVAWAHPKAPAVREHLKLYWAFQKGFAVASKNFRAGQLDVEFPTGATRPPTYVSLPS